MLSLVSTFLITCAVVVMSVALATTVAIKDPNQPATLHSRKRREPTVHPKREGRRKRAAVAREKLRPAAEEATRPLRVPLAVPATMDTGGFSDHWLPAPARISPWVRLRSGVLLTILLTLVGTLVAASVAGVLVFFALALRSAVS
jgi:hypothetical protein